MEQMTDIRRAELQVALDKMQALADAFYYHAREIGVHPFIEFNGLQQEYIKCCRNALNQGVDFAQCNKHAGNHLPMEAFEINYVNEKLDCIFTGRSVMSQKTDIEVGDRVEVTRTLHSTKNDESDTIYQGWLLTVTELYYPYCSAEFNGRRIYDKIPLNSLKLEKKHG